MKIDITKFNSVNVIDTCSIWNLLSSKLFYSVSSGILKGFILTNFVLYECLFKPRKSYNEKELGLIKFLKAEFSKGIFKEHNITIEDLQHPFIINNRKSLGNGELSSIILAYKYNISIITDDQKARDKSEDILEKDKIQTIPHLLGWLIFGQYITEHDYHEIIRQHKESDRKLEKYFNETYKEAFRILNL